MNRASAASPSLVTHIATYPVVGASWASIAEVMALLGPLRSGVRYPAYTDWEVSWSFRPAEREARWVALEPRVVARVTITLPEWLAPVSASPELRAAWSAHLAELREHEEGHAQHARTAALELSAALASLAPCNAAHTLVARATRIADRIIERARQSDRHHDQPPGVNTMG